MPKRSNGEGNIYFRKYDNRWMVSFKTSNYKPNGKREIIYKYAKTQAEASEILRKLQVEKQIGIRQGKQIITTGEWIRLWIDNYKAPKLKQSSLTSYNNNFRCHIEPYIGSIPLNKLELYDVQLMLNKVKDSPSLFMKVYTVINGAMREAVIQKHISTNPCLGVAFPAEEDKDMRVFTKQEQAQFIQHLEGEYYRPLFLTYLMTGMRLGEAPALRWYDIDLEKQTISVNKKVILKYDRNAEKGKRATQIEEDSCKTKSSRRTIMITAGLVNILAEHKKEQQALAEKEGQQWDENWLVFPNSRGNIPNLRNIDAAFHKILRNAGIQEATPHCLRHTYATRNFENGVDIKMISKQLGHKSVRTTYDIYIHVIKDSAAVQIEKLNELDLMLA